MFRANKMMIHVCFGSISMKKGTSQNVSVLFHVLKSLKLFSFMLSCNIFKFSKYFFMIHHHHQVPDLEQTLAAMPLQTSLSSDNFKKFKPLLCPPSYKDYQEMLFFVCPYRVCLLLFQLKIRIPSLYVYTHVLKIPFASF